MKDFLFRLAAQIPEDIKRSAFLINNYDLVLLVLRVHFCAVKLINNETKLISLSSQERNLMDALEMLDFQEVFDMEVHKFVEQELYIYFSGIINFVKKKTQNPEHKVDSSTSILSNTLVELLNRLLNLILYRNNNLIYKRILICLEDDDKENKQWFDELFLKLPNWFFNIVEMLCAISIVLQALWR